MDPAPYTWRAGPGYIPGPYPELEIPLPPLIFPMAYYNQQYYIYPPTHPAYQFAYAAAAPPPAVAATAASKKSSSSSSSKKEKTAPPPLAPASEAHEKKSANANAPPKLRSGTNYMFPAEHTKLHIFNKSSRVWEDKYKGKTMYVSCILPRVSSMCAVFSWPVMLTF